MNPRRPWMAAAAVAIAGCGMGTPRDAPDEVAGAAVEAAANEWIAAIAAKDADRIAAFFADDAVAMYPLPASTVGREANAAVWSAFFAWKITALSASLYRGIADQAPPSDWADVAPGR